MRKLLVVIDVQNDFVDGSLGTEQARGNLGNIKEKILSYPVEDVIYTMDTHGEDYLETQEGKKLPVPHCIRGTRGWQIQEDIAPLLAQARCYEKPAAGCFELVEDLQELSEKEEIEVELIGFCTDVCVVYNAMLLKTYMPEMKIVVDPACCAGMTPQKHLEALETMRDAQIEIV